MHADPAESVPVTVDGRQPLAIEDVVTVARGSLSEITQDDADTRSATITHSFGSTHSSTQDNQQ